MGFILRTLIAALGLWLATEWVDGISVTIRIGALLPLPPLPAVPPP